MNQRVDLKEKTHGFGEIATGNVVQFPNVLASENLMVSHWHSSQCEHISCSFKNPEHSVSLIFIPEFDSACRLIFQAKNVQFLYPIYIYRNETAFEVVAQEKDVYVFSIHEDFLKQAITSDLYHFLENQLGISDNLLGVQLNRLHILEVAEELKNERLPFRFMSSFLQMISWVLAEVFRVYTNINLRMNMHDIKQLYLVSEKLTSTISMTMNIEQIANEAGMSTTKFKSSFKKLFGQSPYSYFLSHKMDYAKDLIVNQKKAIAEVSETLGYNNTSNFTKIFKKYTTQLPSKISVE